METQREQVRFNVRWMIRGDMPRVLLIEQESFEFPWGEDDFLACLRQRNCVGMVAEIGNHSVVCPRGEIAGFMVYELHRHHMNLMSLAVAPEFRRLGIGGAMVAKLKAKLEQQRREAISTLIRERNLAAQLFFREQGFRTIGTHRNYFEDTTEDAYEFVFELGG